MRQLRGSGSTPGRRFGSDFDANISIGALGPHPQPLYTLQPTRQQKRTWHAQVITYGNNCAHSGASEEGTCLAELHCESSVISADGEDASMRILSGPTIVSTSGAELGCA